MKQLLLLLIVFSAMSVKAQSLKDLLYSGRLKMDSGKVVRSTDDLSTKIDTTTRKPPPTPAQEATQAALSRDSSVRAQLVAQNDTVTLARLNSGDTTQRAIGENTVTTKDNNVTWKNYMDELVGAMRTEVVPNKKLKEGNYSVLIDYEIGLDGQVSVKNVSTSPESTYLNEQVRERITLTAPQLSPQLNAYGKPRKAAKKYTFTINK